jgi:hypothetical protein
VEREERVCDIDMAARNRNSAAWATASPKPERLSSRILNPNIIDTAAYTSSGSSSGGGGGIRASGSMAIPRKPMPKVPPKKPLPAPPPSSSCGSPIQTIRRGTRAVCIAISMLPTITRYEPDMIRGNIALTFGLQFARLRSQSTLVSAMRCIRYR